MRFRPGIRANLAIIEKYTFLFEGELIDMLLLVDVGNTQTVIGVHSGAADGGSYRAMWRISTEKVATSDDVRTHLYPLFRMADISVPDIRRAAVASVVPSLTISWAHAIEKTWGAKPVSCTAKVAHECGLFDADYPAPAEIGSDRVADAIAARALYGDPVVVVDFGTATNIEVIDARGRFVGGVIAPGITTGANALFAGASQVAATGLAKPERVIGKSTAQAVQSGVVFGEVGRVDGLLARIFDEMGRTCPVVATGGLVHTVSSLSQHITDVCPELTLEGLRILAEAVESGKGSQ